jgi:hypothetical protein
VIKTRLESSGSLHRVHRDTRRFEKCGVIEGEVDGQLEGGVGVDDALVGEYTVGV